VTIAGSSGDLVVEGARQHNLKHVSLRIPHNAVTAITGLSGSGKSSLAFDTLFAEGQWRYIESLSTYARLFLERLDRPDVDRLINIRPAIAIEQKNSVRTARSTVATATEVADLLRLLFATIGHLRCPTCREEARGYSPQEVVDDLLSRHAGERAYVLFPFQGTDPLSHENLVCTLLTRGFIRLKCGADIVELTSASALLKDRPSSLDVVVDRLVLAPDNRQRLLEAIELAFREADGRCVVELIGGARVTYGSRFQCQRCGRTFPPLRPTHFSFNHPLGACPACNGFGNILRYDERLVVPHPTRSLVEGAIEPWTKPGSDWWQKQMLLAMKRRGVSLTTPYGQLSDADRALLWKGDKTFQGIDQFFVYLEGKRYKMHVRVFLSRYRSPVLCSTCGGSRLRPESRLVTVAGVGIHQVSDWTVRGAKDWLNALALSAFEQQVAQDILRLLQDKTGLLLRVGLGYLTLSRQVRTLSGGEAQRIALANQLGARLMGTLYVLDEPTIGLHPRDTAVLAGIVRELATNGNTVVMVEHDRHMIGTADYIVELGPGAGMSGGEVIYAGSFQRFLTDSSSITARYLRAEEKIPLPMCRRRGSGNHLVLAGACEHNLKDLTVRIPLGMLVCVTGVSGSGKSTLVEETLYRAAARVFHIPTPPAGRFREFNGIEHLHGVRLIDQQPIGRTPRSNPITYLKGFDEIRSLFARQPEARRQGLMAKDFSFNQPGGRCERCQGNGRERLEMFFFEDVYAICEECNGRRYGPRVMQVRYRGKTIHDVLQMSFDEAGAYFADQGSSRLRTVLRTLAAVGLGYLRLGQPATTLSGGEAQRLKIAAELTRTAPRQHVLYILDEPTTGLHLDDTRRLLAVLGRLVDAGNTVLVVEHHLDVLKTADWIIDLGPEGGDEGGSIVVEGTPEQVAGCENSYTGRFLRALVAGSPVI
jgi:excinuclease ABC subunit A